MVYLQRAAGIWGYTHPPVEGRRGAVTAPILHLVLVDVPYASSVHVVCAFGCWSGHSSQLHWLLHQSHLVRPAS
eukprot:521507-Rhodomonas_salina.1